MSSPRDRALTYASRWGLSDEVDEWGKKFMAEGFEEYEAYWMALEEWDL